MNLDRLLQATPSTISESWYDDGTLVDPGTVTIGITRGDGSILVAAGTATSGTGAAARTFAITTTHTATLDVLTVTWTSPTKGTLTTRIEVVGGFLFSTTEARKLKPLDNATTYPQADLVAARTLAEVALEDACSVAFVPRYGRDVLDGNGKVDILLPHPRPLSVTSATVDGAALDSPALAALVLYRDGRLYNPNAWNAGRGNVVVTYTHGHEFPPPRVGRAALLLAKRVLVDSPVSDRATSLVNQDGTTQFMVTAGVREAVFDIPECNAVVNEYGMTAVG